MAYIPVLDSIPPGVVKTESKHAAEGRWYDIEKMHFERGKPQKWGGWEKRVETAITGTPRGAVGWDATTGQNRLAFGTECKLFLIQGDTIVDITPTRDTGNLANPFTTTLDSPIVNVLDTAHGFTMLGDYVTFSGASAVGGITIDGEYQVTAIIDDDNYEITHTSNATSNDGPGGGASVAYEYDIACGRKDQSLGLGYGLGPYSQEGYGDERTVGAGIKLDPRTWFLHDRGNDLTASYTGGTLYTQDPLTTTRAALVTNAPTDLRGHFITGERFVMALRDNMIVAWPDVDDITVWTPLSTNTANTRTLQHGSQLVAGTAVVSGTSLVWSDTAVYQFQYNPGSTFVYDSRDISRTAGLIGQQAFVSVGGRAYWMSTDGFWLYDGRVLEIPNQHDIDDWFFSMANQDQISKTVCGYNRPHRKVYWIIPQGSNLEPDLYVEVDIDEFHWANSTLARTTATYERSSFGNPIMTSEDGFIYKHELQGEYDADGSAMEAYCETGMVALLEGNANVDIWGFNPDLKGQVGDVTFDLNTYEYPQSSALDTISETLTVGEEQQDFAAAGRMFDMKLTSNTTGGYFRVGKPMSDVEVSDDKR